MKFKESDAFVNVSVKDIKKINADSEELNTFAAVFDEEMKKRELKSEDDIKISLKFSVKMSVNLKK